MLCGANAVCSMRVAAARWPLGVRDSGTSVVEIEGEDRTERMHMILHCFQRARGEKACTSTHKPWRDRIYSVVTVMHKLHHILESSCKPQNRTTSAVRPECERLSGEKCAEATTSRGLSAIGDRKTLTVRWHTIKHTHPFYIHEK